MGQPSLPHPNLHSPRPSDHRSARTGRHAAGRRLKDRLSRTQSALANAYLVKLDFKMARTILRRAVRYNPRLWVLAKFLWSVAAPRSLRREIIRREARRHA
jgi:hypothetical protein